MSSRCSRLDACVREQPGVLRDVNPAPPVRTDKMLRPPACRSATSTPNASSGSRSPSTTTAFVVNPTTGQPRLRPPMTGDYEILFVHDGSPMYGVDRAIALHRSDRHVRFLGPVEETSGTTSDDTGIEHARAILCSPRRRPRRQPDGDQFHRACARPAPTRLRQPGTAQGRPVRTREGAIFYKGSTRCSIIRSRERRTARLNDPAVRQQPDLHRDREMTMAPLWR